MLSRFFIDRPVFAWVVALGVMLAGVIAIFTLPIAQYPTIAPPAVSITATYPGASADTLESSVTQVIELEPHGQRVRRRGPGDLGVVLAMVGTAVVAQQGPGKQHVVG